MDKRGVGHLRAQLVLWMAIFLFHGLTGCVSVHKSGFEAGPVVVDWPWYKTEAKKEKEKDKEEAAAKASKTAKTAETRPK